MGQTFSIITFGCKVNTYESEALKENLIKQGFIYECEKEADIYILNTCAVTQVAEKKAMQELRKINREHPNSQIVVMGCFSQLHPERIKTINNVQILLGVSKRNTIPELLKENKKEELILNTRVLEYEDIPIQNFNSKYRAFVKIQDGCDNFCTYCVIPLTRGKSRSRKKESILKEVEDLGKNGYKEIVLTGIDTGSFNNGENYQFKDLLKDILNLPEKSFRLRISSLETTEVGNTIVELLKTNPRLVPHLHLPLQSGSKKICHLMGRKYDINGFKSLVNKLKNEVDNMAISTDVIVGFPNEEEEDFLDTYKLIEDVKFMRLHVFPYSKRPLTKASKMENQVDRGVSKSRVRRLTLLGEELSKEYYNSYLNKRLIVLIEEKLDDTTYRGYSQNYLDLKVKSEKNILGSFVSVLIEDKPVLDDFYVCDVLGEKII